MLVVEEDKEALTFLKQSLAGLGSARTVDFCEKVFSLEEDYEPDIIFLNLDAPESHGLYTCEWIKEKSGWDSRVVVISKCSSVVHRALELGADGHLKKPLNISEFRKEIGNFMESLRGMKIADPAFVAIDQFSQKVISEMQVFDDRQLMHNNLLFKLLRTAEENDFSAMFHVDRVRGYSECIAKQLAECSGYSADVDEQFIADIYRASPLHDIGNVAVDSGYLRKKGRLTPKEFAQIQKHTVYGAKLFDNLIWKFSKTSFLEMARRIAESHHERWDGNGYPFGYSGIQIPLAARIVSLADTFDALTLERPNRRIYSPAEACELINQDVGKKFDPVVVLAFNDCFEEIQQIREDIASDSETLARETRKAAEAQSLQTQLQDSAESNNEFSQMVKHLTVAIEQSDEHGWPVSDELRDMISALTD